MVQEIMRGVIDNQGQISCRMATVWRNDIRVGREKKGDLANTSARQGDLARGGKKKKGAGEQ